VGVPGAVRGRGGGRRTERRQKGKDSPYSTAERRVPELIPLFDSQPAGDVSYTHKMAHVS